MVTTRDLALVLKAVTSHSKWPAVIKANSVQLIAVVNYKNEQRSVSFFSQVFARTVRYTCIGVNELPATIRL